MGMSMMSDNAIELYALTKKYRLSRKEQRDKSTASKEFTAVDSLSFTVQKGEIYGLLGPNGAGKTTTLRMLATLIRPDSGNAFIDGVSILENPSRVRSKIGFLTNDLKLDEVFTPDYLFDLSSRLYHVSRDSSQRHKEQLFQLLGIDKFAHTRLGDLSTGMKQKTSLAVSLAHNPDVIIFDEPTNGLDIVSGKVITDFMMQLKAEGKTILLSTHMFDVVEKVCDSIGILLAGSLQISGNCSRLCANESLEKLFFDIYERNGRQ